jgi:hypothetical protein
MTKSHIKVTKSKYNSILEKAQSAYTDKRYLEAFLVQSCLIEGVIRAYAVSKLYLTIIGNSVLEEKLKRWELSNLLDALLFAEKIDSALYDELNKYRKKRNEVVHNLLSADDEEINKELKSAYELGRKMKGLIVDDIQRQLDPILRSKEIEEQIKSLNLELSGCNRGSRSHTYTEAQIYNLLLELMAISDGQGMEFEAMFPDFKS